MRQMYGYVYKTQYTLVEKYRNYMYVMLSVVAWQGRHTFYGNSSVEKQRQRCDSSHRGRIMAF